jgi:hypothetical protein
MKTLRRFTPAVFAVLAGIATVVPALASDTVMNVDLSVHRASGNTAPLSRVKVRMYMGRSNDPSIHYAQMDLSGNGSTWAFSNAERICWIAYSQNELRETDEECFEGKNQPASMKFVLPQ